MKVKIGMEIWKQR